MRSRLFTIARFAVYAVVVAIGVNHLLDRAEASGEPPPRGVTTKGTTTQGRPVWIGSRDGRVVGIKLRWTGRCDGGGTWEERDWLSDSQATFRRAGQHFVSVATQSNTWPTGRSAVLEWRLQGTSENGVARGSVDLTLHLFDRVRHVDTCRSGSIGFAVDLPR